MSSEEMGWPVWTCERARRRLAWLALGSGVLCVAGAAIAVVDSDGIRRAIGALGVPLFGVGFVLCARQLFQTGPALWVDAAGIHDGAMSIPWDHVTGAASRVHVVDQWPKVEARYVVLNLKPGSGVSRSLTASRALTTPRWAGQDQAIILETYIDATMDEVLAAITKACPRLAGSP
jgi:hypothetical protein